MKDSKEFGRAESRLKIFIIAVVCMIAGATKSAARAGMNENLILE